MQLGYAVNECVNSGRDRAAFLAERDQIRRVFSERSARHLSARPFFAAKGPAEKRRRGPRDPGFTARSNGPSVAIDRGMSILRTGFFVAAIDLFSVVSLAEETHINSPGPQDGASTRYESGASTTPQIRKEWHELTTPELKAAARSTAVIFENKDGYLEKTADGYRLSSSTPTFGEANHLCPGEPFADQVTPGHCSSTLVGKDVVLTAHHCLQQACSELTFVFGFLLKTKSANPTKFDNDQVYRCKNVIEGNKEEDWVLLRLDRAVQGREPVQIRLEGSPQLGDPMVLAGYPDGMPMKGHEASPMVENQNADKLSIFEVVFNALGGDSGSGVFNEKTAQLEGLMNVAFGGFDDSTDPKTGKPCKRVRTGVDTPAWVVRASLFKEAIKRANL